MGDSTSFEVSNSLRQGYVLAPTLFILFFNVVIWCSRQRSAQFWVRFLYKCGGKLVGEEVRAPSTSWMTELSFVNYVAVVASTRQDLVKATLELNSVVTACGLTISIPKTKILVVGSYVVQSDLDPTAVGSWLVLSDLWHRFVILALLWNPIV